MRNVWIWFLLSCKRYVKQLPFLAVLLLLPAAAFGAAGLNRQEADKIRIAVWAEPAGDEGAAAAPLEALLAQRLAGGSAHGDGMFQFYLCDSEEQLKDDVAARRAECGYVISRDLREKLNNREFKRSITVYSAPSTVAASLSTETVFAAMMEMYDREILENYVAYGETGRRQNMETDESAFSALGEPGSEARLTASAQAGELYDKWSANGSTFQFRYVYGVEDSRQAEGDPGRAGSGAPGAVDNQAGPVQTVLPIRGIAALCIFITGLYSGVVVMRDERRGLFRSLDYRLSLPCRLASLAAPVALAGMSGLGAIWAGGELGNFGTEAAALLCYCIAVLVFSWFLKLLLPSPELLCSLVPFFIIGSLLFCPIIIDASRFLPGLAAAGRLFLPWYYLKWLVY